MDAIKKKDVSLVPEIERRRFGCLARRLDCRHRREIKSEKVKKRIDENFLDDSGGMRSLLGISSGGANSLVPVRSSRCGRLPDQFLEAF